MCWPLSSVRPSRLMLRARPPRTRPASNSVVRAPPAASSTAAAMPAQPPPMTAIFKGSALDPGFCRQPELSRRRQRNALMQHPEVLATDLVEHGAVDGSHDQPRPLALAVNRREVGKRLLVILFRALVLELHEGGEVVRVTAIEDIGGRHVELFELIHRDVDATTPGVLADVADDVGELE